MPGLSIACRGEWRRCGCARSANHDTIDRGALDLGTGLTLDDFELRVAVPAVETGTLNRSAAILIQAGFASRLAAIKAVHDTEGSFQSAHELEAWLKSEKVELLSAAGEWPSAETAEMWHAFRASYTPTAKQTWKKSAARAEALWQHEPGKGSPVRLFRRPPEWPHARAVARPRADWHVAPEAKCPSARIDTCRGWRRRPCRCDLLGA